MIDSGVWLRAHEGAEQGIKIIRIAKAHGWKQDVSKLWLKYSLFKEFQEDYWDTWLDAEDYLNEHIASEGYRFGSNNVLDWGQFPDGSDFLSAHPLEYLLDWDAFYKTNGEKIWVK